MSRACAHGASRAIWSASVINGAASERAMCGPLLPQPASSTVAVAASATIRGDLLNPGNPSWLDAACEPGGEILGEARGPHLCLRLFDRIRNSPKGCPSRVDVNQEPRGARVAVPGLAYGTWIDQPACARRIELGAAVREAAVQPHTVPGERQCQMAVADEHDRRGRELEV